MLNLQGLVASGSATNFNVYPVGWPDTGRPNLSTARRVLETDAADEGVFALSLDDQGDSGPSNDPGSSSGGTSGDQSGSGSTGDSGSTSGDSGSNQNGSGSNGSSGGAGSSSGDTGGSQGGSGSGGSGDNQSSSGSSSSGSGDNQSSSGSGSSDNQGGSGSGGAGGSSSDAGGSQGGSSTGDNQAGSGVVLVDNQGGSGSLPPGNQGGSGSSAVVNIVAPNLQSPQLAAAVASFKAVFASNPDTLSFGQFHITNLVFNALSKLIEADLAAKPNSDVQQAWATTLGADLMSDKTLIDTIKTKGLTADYPNIVKVWAADAQATQGWAGSLYTQFWGNANILPSPSIGQPSIDKYRAAWNYEKDKCFNASNAVARKFLKAKSPGPIPTNLKISQGQIASCRVVNDAASSLDQIVYGNTTALAQIVQGIKKAIDAGYLVLCGVLSGRRHDMSQYPNPEHYLLLHGYDGDTFVFWDSDDTVSNIQVTGWGQGYGALIFSGSRFSTGLDDADLAAVDGGGNHTASPKRHRYQVYYVQTLPVALAATATISEH